MLFAISSTPAGYKSAVAYTFLLITILLTQSAGSAEIHRNTRPDYFPFAVGNKLIYTSIKDSNDSLYIEYREFSFLNSLYDSVYDSITKKYVKPITYTSGTNDTISTRLIAIAYCDINGSIYYTQLRNDTISDYFFEGKHTYIPGEVFIEPVSQVTYEAALIDTFTTPAGIFFSCFSVTNSNNDFKQIYAPGIGQVYISYGSVGYILCDYFIGNTTVKDIHVDQSKNGVDISQTGERIRVCLPSGTASEIVLYNLLGKQICRLHNGFQFKPVIHLEKIARGKYLLDVRSDKVTVRKCITVK